MTTEPDSNGTAATHDWTQLTPEQIEAMFPADPDIMKSPEHDFRGLREVQAMARARRDELDRKYPGLRVS